MRPASRNELQHEEKTDQRAAHIEDHLHNISPDDRRHSAFEGIKQGQANDQRNGGNFASAQNNGNHDRHGKYANALRQSSQYQKSSRRKFSYMLSKAPLHQLIGGIHLAAKILR